MPVHDWTRVDAGIFHDFHQAWNAELRAVLNSGLLPADFYALIEQHAGRSIPDLLTLHASAAHQPLPQPQGGVAVAEVRPKMSRRVTVPAKPQRRTVAIRHTSGHRLIAILEIVSPANKDRAESVAALADKVADALRAGIHVMVIDLFPHGRHDPEGLHGAIWSRIEGEPCEMPMDRPLTVASYLADWSPEAWMEHRAVGEELPNMPLFLTAEICVPVPLEATYQDAFRTAPAFWQDVLEGRRNPDDDATA